jgi:hypothetical protein
MSQGKLNYWHRGIKVIQQVECEYENICLSHCQGKLDRREHI